MIFLYLFGSYRCPQSISFFLKFFMKDHSAFWVLYSTSEVYNHVGSVPDLRRVIFTLQTNFTSYNKVVAVKMAMEIPEGNDKVKS